MRTTFIQQPGEELRQIEDFPTYLVSSYGRVISEPSDWHRGRIVIKPWFTGDAHLNNGAVQLCRDGVKHTAFIRRLVALAFHPESYHPDLEVCHRPDNNPMNNRADNLVWDLPQVNQWERYFAANPNWLEDVYIYEDTRGRKKPFYIRLNIEGKMTNHKGGGFETKEEAHPIRDAFCIECGVPTPLEIRGMMEDRGYLFNNLTCLGHRDLLPDAA